MKKNQIIKDAQTAVKYFWTDFGRYEQLKRDDKFFLDALYNYIGMLEDENDKLFDFITNKGWSRS